MARRNLPSAPRRAAAAKRLSAVALRYHRERDRAPKVAAKGKGRVAEEILRVAREKGIPIREDADLLELLYPLELEDEIPPALYGVVAELIAHLYRLNREAGRR